VELLQRAAQMGYAPAQAVLSSFFYNVNPGEEFRLAQLAALMEIVLAFSGSLLSSHQRAAGAPETS
jgi:hypothetical protein